MRCSVVLEFYDDDGSAARRVELIRLHRSDDRPAAEDVGLTLEEGKSLLAGIQDGIVMEQVERFCSTHQACTVCGAKRRLHDERCGHIRTAFGSLTYVRPRWKACPCGADGSRYVSPLERFIPASSTPELRWLHAKLGGLLPFRQGCDVMDLLLPMSGRHNHVTMRNHTIAVAKLIEADRPPRKQKPDEAVAELGIDVGYVRQTRSTGPSSMAIVAAAVGPVGKRPRVWASALPRSPGLRAEMCRFLEDSGYEASVPVHVLTDGAKDLIGVARQLPHKSRWLLDWAHIGRLLRRLEQRVAPWAYGRVTAEGSMFELWDHFVRFRSLVWTGKRAGWKRVGERLYGLFGVRGIEDPGVERPMKEAQRRLGEVLNYLEANESSLIDYRRWQQLGRRISTGFVEGTINRLIGRRMCKGQQMRWTRAGAHAVLQVRAAILNEEFDARAREKHPWIGQRQVSWPWREASHPS